MIADVRARVCGKVTSVIRFSAGAGTIPRSRFFVRAVALACLARVPLLASPVRAEVSTSETPAPPARSLALREVLSRAVTGNIDLVRERATIDKTLADVLAAEGQFDFILTGDGTFTRRLPPPISITTQAGGLTQNLTALTQSLTADLALTRPLESGGQVTLAAQGAGTFTTSQAQCGTGTDSCTYYNSNLALTFFHPLLRGFGTEVTLAKLRKARIQKDAELLNRQARASVVVRDVVTAYWEFSYAADDLAIRQSAVTLAEEQRKYTQAQVEVGRLGVASLAAVDRAIADREQDVAVSEQTLIGRRSIWSGCSAGPYRPISHQRRRRSAHRPCRR